MWGGIFEKNKIQNKIGEFNAVIEKENFWKDKLLAQKTLKEKSFLENIINSFSLTKNELNICNVLKPYLTKNNLFLVGIDLIDNKLTEINVTSPTGLIQIKDVSKIDISKIIWDKLL